MFRCSVRSRCASTVVFSVTGYSVCVAPLSCFLVLVFFTTYATEFMFAECANSSVVYTHIPSASHK